MQKSDIKIGETLLKVIETGNRRFGQVGLLIDINPSDHYKRKLLFDSYLPGTGGKSRPYTGMFRDSNLEVVL